MINKFDKTFENKLEKTIEAIELDTSVEVVAAVTPSCDSYCDAYYKGGLIFMTVMLGAVLYAPINFPEHLIPIDLGVAFALGVLLVWLFRPLKRLLISRKRREACVTTAANAYFRQNGLSETIERSAFLVYVSTFEKAVRIIGDSGIRSNVPDGEWREIVASFDDIFSGPQLAPQAILNALPTAAPPFSKYMPPAENNIDELSNRLRRDNE